MGPRYYCSLCFTDEETKAQDKQAIPHPHNTEVAGPGFARRSVMSPTTLLGTPSQHMLLPSLPWMSGTHQSCCGPCLGWNEAHWEGCTEERAAGEAAGREEPVIRQMSCFFMGNFTLDSCPLGSNSQEHFWNFHLQVRWWWEGCFILIWNRRLW